MREIFFLKSVTSHHGTSLGIEIDITDCFTLVWAFSQPDVLKRAQVSEADTTVSESQLSSHVRYWTSQ